MVAAASQGLGYAIAKVLAEEGALVSIAARKQETIEAAAARIGHSALPFAADVKQGRRRWKPGIGPRLIVSAESTCSSPIPAVPRRRRLQL